MRRQRISRVVPSLLATLLAGLAFEKLPDSATLQRPSFAVTADAGDRITGGGKLGDGRDFATFGFDARSGQGQIEWVQHCLDGVTASTTCLLGSFTFHGSAVTAYGAVPEDPIRCRAWSGTGEARFKDLGTTGSLSYTAKACDFGEPGHDGDTMCFMVGTYLREGILAGGNIQLHPGTPENTVVTCSERQPT